MEAATQEKQQQIRLKRVATYKYNHGTKTFDLVVKEESEKPKIVIDVTGEKGARSTDLTWDEKEKYSDVGHVFKRYHWSRETSHGLMRYELNMIVRPHRLERFKGNNTLPHAYEEYVQV